MERRAHADRRAFIARFHIPERRTGFDRRHAHDFLCRLRDSPDMLAVLLGLFAALSLADGGLTAYELSNGLASEGNPVLSGLIAAHPALAAGFKLAVTAAVVVAIWRGRRYRRILGVGVFALVVYSALLAYHVGWLYGTGVI